MNKKGWKSAYAQVRESEREKDMKYDEALEKKVKLELSGHYTRVRRRRRAH